MKKLKLYAIAAFMAVFSFGLFIPVSSVSAVDPLATVCEDNSGSPLCNKEDTPESLIKNIINTLLYIVGMLSVIMIIWSGIRYTTSAGNAGSVTSAKSTLTYSIVGLIVSILAYAIVNWVVKIF